MDVAPVLFLERMSKKKMSETNFELKLTGLGEEKTRLLFRRAVLIRRASQTCTGGNVADLMDTDAPRISRIEKTSKPTLRIMSSYIETVLTLTKNTIDSLLEY